MIQAHRAHQGLYILMSKSCRVPNFTNIIFYFIILFTLVQYNEQCIMRSH